MGEKKIIYDDEFKVESTEKLRDFNNEFINYTKQRLEEYKSLFGTESLDKLKFHIFDDLEKYRKDYQERCKRQAPSYSRGCFSHDSVHMVVDKPLISGSDYFYRTRATGAHEAFHIYYRKLIYRHPENRVVWFDEGMAQFFSKEKEYMNDESFARYYLKFKREYKPVANLNKRVQGNNTVPDDRIFSRKGIINGYPLSYLAIRYLAETKGINYIKEVMRDNDKILELGNTITDEMISYYDGKISEREDELTC